MADTNHNVINTTRDCARSKVVVVVVISTTQFSTSQCLGPALLVSGTNQLISEENCLQLFHIDSIPLVCSNCHLSEAFVVHHSI